MLILLIINYLSLMPNKKLIYKIVYEHIKTILKNYKIWYIFI